MKKIVKNSLKKSLYITKKLANSNKYTKKIAQRTKHLVIQAIGTDQPREVYNLASFYPTVSDYFKQTKDLSNNDGPLISILMPTYNTPEKYLRECIESIIVQSYPNWELCIADDQSSITRVIEIIKEYQAEDNRIKLIERKKNGHISEATNSALELAKGEFIGLMDHDDVLWPNALYEVVQVIRENKGVDFIYSDEDKIDSTSMQHSYPFLKPDFSPEFLESCNYITHFSCIRTAVIKAVGGLRKGYEGAQDWDLFMRVSEKTNRIVHIPKLLYSWRIHEASTASSTDAKPYVYEAQKRLLIDHIERIGMKGDVEVGIIPQHRTIKYVIGENDLLSVIVLYENNKDTQRLLGSLVNNSPGAPFEVVYLHSKAIIDEVRDEFYKIATNVSQNFISISKGEEYIAAIENSHGNYLFFARDNIEVISDNWAKTIMGDSQLSKVGLVGPVLLDTTKRVILSAGIGLEYGPNGYADMLEGMPFDDPHYSRGLFAKSRRNVSAVNDCAYAIKKETLNNLVDKQTIPRNSIELSILLMAQGYRHIYTPYVQVVAHDSLPKTKLVNIKSSGEDRYLNLNFNHENQRMEVRA
jgi:glycosyltransferase involved in cell wall biosynthesis